MIVVDKMCEDQKEKVKIALTAVFHDIDKDKSGFLDQAELEHVISAYVEHPDCPADFKAEHGSPEKIKGLCQVGISLTTTRCVIHNKP